MKILDIWAIQLAPNELYTALKNIKSDVTIFENLICEFNFNGKILNRQFDNLIYSEDDDTLILLMRSGLANIEQAKDFFDDNNIPYNTIKFSKSISKFEDDKDLKEFWFARDLYVVEDAIKDSISKGNNICKVDFNVPAYITLKYLTNNNKLYNLLKINLKGAMEFEDKIVAITHTKHQNNITPLEVYNVLNENAVELTDELDIDKKRIKF